MPTIKPRIPFLIHCLSDGKNGSALWQNSTFQQLFASLEPSFYPFEGLWPDDDDSLPRNLSRSDSEAIKNFIQALKTKEDTVEWWRFQRDGIHDEYQVGRVAAAKIFEGLMKMAKISDKLDRTLLEKGYHPAALSSQNLPCDLDSHRTNVQCIIGEALWGPEAVNEQFGVLRPEYTKVTDGFIGQSWGRLRRKMVIWQNNWENKLKEMEDAWDRLDRGEVTKASVRKAIKNCHSLLTQATLMHDGTVLAKAGEHLAKLQGLMAGLQETQLQSSGKAVSRSSFATEDEVRAVLAEYYDLFQTPHPTPQLVRDLPEIDSDSPYLDPLTRLEERELRSLLGLDPATGRVPFFNEYLSHSGLSQSEHPRAFVECQGKTEGELPEGFEPCRLRWAQLVGIAAMINMWTVDDDPERRRSLLLTDEVGVGKTGTVMGAIAVYAHARKLQEADSPLPPIFKRRQWGAADGLPDAPWLIICPASLVGNWTREFNRFFKKGAIRLFQYGGTYASHSNFWTEQSEWWAKPVGLGEYQKVVICSTSALASDATQVLELHKTKVPASKARAKQKTAGPSIFDIQWTGVAFDEAHELRTRNVKFEAMTNIRERTHSLVLATATPLFTGSQDLLNLQRVAGLGDYGAPADQMEKVHRREITAQKRQNDKDRRLGEKTADEMRDALSVVTIKHVEQIKGQFQGRIIRRTPDSVKWDGTPLLPLPELQSLAAFITLSDKEMHALDEIRNEATSEEGSDTFTSKAFYTPFRTTISHYLLAKGDSFTLPETLEEWKGVRSTKFDKIVELVNYILRQDDSPKDFADEATGEFRLPSFRPNADGKRTDKVVIYQEYMSHAPLLKKILELNGIDVLLMNGLVGMREREAVMMRFNAQDGPRVLLISRVGTTGLNMSRANHIVIVDLQWAEQDNKQAVGRVWRYPQRKTVYAYYLVARNTTDEMIARVAGAKGTLLGMFLDDDISSPLAQFLDENHPLTDTQAGLALQRAVEEERLEDEKETRRENTEKVKAKPKRARKQKPGATDCDPLVSNDSGGDETRRSLSRKETASKPKPDEAPRDSSLPSNKTGTKRKPPTLGDSDLENSSEPSSPKTKRRKESDDARYAATGAKEVPRLRLPTDARRQTGGDTDSSPTELPTTTNGAVPMSGKGKPRPKPRPTHLGEKTKYKTASPSLAQTICPSFTNGPPSQELSEQVIHGGLLGGIDNFWQKPGVSDTPQSDLDEFTQHVHNQPDSEIVERTPDPPVSNPYRIPRQHEREKNKMAVMNLVKLKGSKIG